MEDNKKRIKDISHREVSTLSYQNLTKNIVDLKEEISKKISFLDRYNKKEKIIEERSKAYEMNVKKKEKELKNRNSKSFIKILDRLISSETTPKEEKDLFITGGDCGFVKLKNNLDVHKNRKNFFKKMKTNEKSSVYLNGDNLLDKMNLDREVVGQK